MVGGRILQEDYGREEAVSVGCGREEAASVGCGREEAVSVGCGREGVSGPPPPPPALPRMKYGIYDMWVRAQTCAKRAKINFKSFEVIMCWVAWRMSLTLLQSGTHFVLGVVITEGHDN